MAYKSPLRKQLPTFEADYGKRQYETPVDAPESSLGNSMQSFTSLGSLSNDSDNSDTYVNPARAARQEGRQERREARQNARAARITNRNVERLKKTNERIKAMSDSPAKFFGGIAAATLGRKASSGGGFDRAKYERLAQRGGGFGNLAQQVLDQNPVADPTTASQAQQAAANASILPEASINDGVDPILAGAGVAPSGTTDPGNPFQGKTFKIEPASPTTMKENETTYDPPTPANMMGNAKPIFNSAVQASAEAIYGTPEQRQMSMPGAPMFLKDVPEGDKGAGLRKLPNSVVEKMGYDAATKMVSPLNDNHFGDKKMLKTLTKKKTKPYTKEQTQPVPYTKKQLEARNATIKQAYGVTLDGKRVDLGNITSTEISPKEFKQR